LHWGGSHGNRKHLPSRVCRAQIGCWQHNADMEVSGQAAGTHAHATSQPGERPAARHAVSSYKAFACLAQARICRCLNRSIRLLQRRLCYFCFLSQSSLCWCWSLFRPLLVPGKSGTRARQKNSGCFENSAQIFRLNNSSRANPGRGCFRQDLRLRLMTMATIGAHRAVGVL
jgi:hypothetical protein